MSAKRCRTCGIKDVTAHTLLCPPTGRRHSWVDPARVRPMTAPTDLREAAGIIDARANSDDGDGMRATAALLRTAADYQHEGSEYDLVALLAAVDDVAAAYLGEEPQSGGTFTKADPKDPLRQGDTVPVDRNLIKPLRDICRELGYLCLLRRLPDPDREPQP